MLLFAAARAAEVREPAADEPKVCETPPAQLSFADSAGSS